MHVNFNDSATRHFRLESKPAVTVIDLTVDENEKKRKGVSTATNSEGGPQKKKCKKCQLETELQEMKDKLALTVQAMYDIGDSYEEVREENKRLRASNRAARRAHAATIQDLNSQLKTKSDAEETLNSYLTEANASKAEIEFQLHLKIAELQEMTAKASYAEERVNSLGENLAQELQAKADEVSQLNAKIGDMEVQHEDALAKKEEERKHLQSSINAAKQTHTLQIQDMNSQLKTKSDTIESLKSHVTEVNASKAEIESELHTKTAELQEMTAKASDAEMRVKSVEEKLAQALKEKRSEVSQLSAKVENMKGRHENTLKRKEEEKSRLEKKLECLQSQMESRKKSAPNTKSCLEGNNTGKPVRKTIKRKLRAELEALMNTNDIPDVSLDDIIGQEKAKAALSELKPFRDPEYECFYADDEDDNNSNTGILLYGPPGTGKTMFAKALATSGGCIFMKISPDDILKEYIGQSEERIRAVFLIAKEKAAESGKAAVLFIDECDRLFRKPGMNDCEVTVNITGIFQECMNGIDEPKGQLIVLGATNYKNKLPEPILSRFAYKIEVNLPDTKERIAILESIVKTNHSLTEDALARFADMTGGYSGRDIFNLITKGAEPARKKEAIEHIGAWCKNEKDQFIPCYHSPDHPCRDKESGTFREVKERTKAKEFRPRPLAMKHIEMGIDFIGADKHDEHEEEVTYESD